jgi:hypothetical protein
MTGGPSPQYPLTLRTCKGVRFEDYKLYIYSPPHAGNPTDLQSTPL